MTIKRIFSWFVIFLVLTVFSIFTLAGATAKGQNIVLAKTIQNEPELNQSTHVIVVSDDAPSLFMEGFLQRFAFFNQHHLICSVSKRQYQALTLLYDTSTDSLPLKTGLVDVVKVKDKELTRGDLMRIIKTSSDPGKNMHCRAMKFDNVLYVLLGENLS